MLVRAERRFSDGSAPGKFPDIHIKVSRRVMAFVSVLPSLNFDLYALLILTYEFLPFDFYTH